MSFVSVLNHLRQAALVVLLAPMLTAASVSQAAATDARIEALTRDMDCAVYRLSDKRQRIALTSENTIPGASSAWALLNEGPARVTIFASNGDKISLRVFSGGMELFIGDARYTYSVGLSGNGSAVVYVCR